MEYHIRLSEWLKATTNKPLPQAFEDFRIKPQLYHEVPGNGICTCGKSHLHKVYVIEYIPDGTLHNIGSSCIERFQEMFENQNISEYEQAYQNLQEMTQFVYRNEQERRNVRTKGKCLVCSQLTVGNDTQKAKTNYYHFCSDCVAPKTKRRRCVQCREFCHDISAPLYRTRCYKCYFDSAV